MLYFSKAAPRLAFAAPSVQLAALGAVLFLSGLGARGLALALESIPPNLLDDPGTLTESSSAFRNVGAALLASASLATVLALVIRWKATDSQRMRIMVRGGALRLLDGQPASPQGGRAAAVRSLQGNGAGIIRDSCRSCRLTGRRHLECLFEHQREPLRALRELCRDPDGHRRGIQLRNVRRRGRDHRPDPVLR